MLRFSAVLIATILVCHVQGLGKPKWTTKRDTHRFKRLEPSKLQTLAKMSEDSMQFDKYLDDLVDMPRVPGTETNELARERIIGHIKDIGGWKVELDAFDTDTVIGPVHFVNIIATLNPTANRRLVLACHYDTKLLPSVDNVEFVGATDSAVPCSMMLDLIYHLDTYLKAFKRKQKQKCAERKLYKSQTSGVHLNKRRQNKIRVQDITLQLLFFDGEEAFKQWTSTDSIYGARHLAEKMSKTPHPPGSKDTTELDAIDLFVLLDLLGAAEPQIVNHYENTRSQFEKLQKIEERLHSGNLLTRSYKATKPYFRGSSKTVYGQIEDDHKPFKERGVPILHMITTPFPRVWHTLDDNRSNIHGSTVDNLSRILRVFVAEYLGLDIPSKRK
uniref:glutaminyl-peptide cyclotransferase n=1 Tax=Saccoglossus kowalevskii TaxID=10224 RepID=A0ABM0MUR0_SACKO|nr:PREDICTED: glutaminyl-peptide cyclotransferase-like isoform X2 [Saccoglossus kowalevskii]